MVEKNLSYYFKNQNRKLHSKSKDEKTEADCSKQSNNLDLMTQEIGQENINRNVLKKLLNETRNNRNSDVVKLCAYDLLQKYTVYPTYPRPY